MDDDTGWQKQVLVGLAVLVAVGALVGGVVALVSIKAADLAGIGSTSPTSVDRPQVNSGGSGQSSSTAPTTTPTTPSGTPSTTRSTTASGPTSKPNQPVFTLTASPTQVGSLQRINLTGRYKAPDGTVLQVQRREGGQWTDFPVTATVNNGTFATYVETGHPGPNRFRMLDVRATDASNTVVVTVA
jgi:hypothetical protein